MNRKFSSGSRQAPDPLDKFLEGHDFYRKHTARDASCLFRVVSEQVYDTQMHHMEIRKRCVRYIRKHREFFQPYIEYNIDDYLDDMSKPKTYGTLIELRAVGYLFQRNIFIFEAYDLGNLFVGCETYRNCIRVFHTPELHFDSVYTMKYIKDVAVCQSVCYEILYKDFFRIPDVSYAVERMLHPSTFDNFDEKNDCLAPYHDQNRHHYKEYNGYVLDMTLNGQTFKFDLPSDTNCILEDYKLCHFHNSNFTLEFQQQQQVMTTSTELESVVDDGTNDGAEGRATKAMANKNLYKNSGVESALTHKFVSCVRQLLNEGITPFPYKVAKALDPSMYRNIEFDAWNEARKELKLQNWYNGDANFKVGAKCNVKLQKSGSDLFTCHIQEMSPDEGFCVVFVEQLGEKLVVSYDALIPLPPDQFKPWALPYRYQRRNVTALSSSIVSSAASTSSFRFVRHHHQRNQHQHYNYWKLLNQEHLLESSTSLHQYVNCDNTEKEHEKKFVSSNNFNNYYNQNKNSKVKQLTNMKNLHRVPTATSSLLPPFEYCTMPITFVNNRSAFDQHQQHNGATTQTFGGDNLITNSDVTALKSKTQKKEQVAISTIDDSNNYISNNNNVEQPLSAARVVIGSEVNVYELEKSEMNGVNDGVGNDGSSGFIGLKDGTDDDHVHCMYPLQSFDDGKFGVDGVYDDVGDLRVNDGVEEYYFGGSGCYQESPVATTIPATAAVPPNVTATSIGGTLYYMYNHNNNLPAPHIYMQYQPCYPPPTQQLSTMASQPSMLPTLHQQPVSNGFYYPTTPAVIPYCITNLSSDVPPVIYQTIQHQQPMQQHQHNSNVTTTTATLAVYNHKQSSATFTNNNVSIDYNAKKSLKSNGFILPDVTTLRYFYNLGLDYYHNHYSTNSKHNKKINDNELMNADVAENTKSLLQAYKVKIEKENEKAEEQHDEILSLSPTSSPIFDNNNNKDFMTNVSVNSIDLINPKSITKKQSKYNNCHNQQRRCERYQKNHYRQYNCQKQRGNTSDSGTNQQQYKNNSNLNTKLKNNFIATTTNLHCKYKNNRNHNFNQQEITATNNSSSNSLYSETISGGGGGSVFVHTPTTIGDSLYSENISGGGESGFVHDAPTIDGVAIDGGDNLSSRSPQQPQSPIYCGSKYLQTPTSIFGGSTTAAATTNSYEVSVYEVNSGGYTTLSFLQPRNGDITNDNHQNGGDSGGNGIHHFQYSNYPPPAMSLYCPTGGMAGVNVAAISTASATHPPPLVPQGFFCLPPPQIPNTPPLLLQPITNIRNNAVLSSNLESAEDSGNSISAIEPLPTT